MRNLITGIFAILAGTILFCSQQALEGNQSKSRDQIKEAHDSISKKPDLKTPEPDLTSETNFKK